MHGFSSLSALNGTGMIGDFISLRILLLSESALDRNMIRRGAALASFPVDFAETGNPDDACAIIARNQVDMIFVDAALPALARTAVIARARAAQRKPFVFLVAANRTAASNLVGGETDGVVSWPMNLLDSEALFTRCSQTCIPHSVLVVDDSLTVRNIVRKVLEASRYRINYSEAAEGAAAVRQIAGGKIKLVFLDYHMPGLDGIETLTAIKHDHPDLHVVIMTSATDGTVAELAIAPARRHS
jgi:CheY-like chemotaxis protein